MLNKLNLAGRLTAGFGFLLLLTMAVSIFSLYEISTLHRLNQSIYRHPFTVKSAVLEIDAKVIRIHRAMKDIVLSNNLAEIQREQANINRLSQEVRAQFAIIEDRFLGEASMYLEAEALFAQWEPIRQTVIQLVLNGRRDEAAEITKNQGAHHVIRIIDSLGRLSAFAENKAATFGAESERAARASMGVMILLGVLALASGLGLALVISRSIVVRAKRIARAAEAIAAGDLSQRIRPKGNDELDQMAESLRRMLDGVIGEGQSLKNGISVPFWTTDTELNLTFMNNAASEVLQRAGCTPPALGEAAPLSKAWPDRHGITAVQAAQCLNTKRKLEAQVSFGDDGDLVVLQQTLSPLLSQDGQLIGIMGIGVDITANLEATESLRKSQLLLNEVGGISRIGGWELDLGTGQTKWTELTYEIMGLNPGSPLPEVPELLDRFEPEYGRLAQRSLLALTELGEPCDFEAQINNYRDEIIWCRIVGNADRHEGKTRRVVAAIQDITTQKEVEKQVALLDAQLRQAQKMEAIGTLAGGIAHDFNNILSAIIGYTELSINDLPEGDHVRSNLNQVIESSWRARSLVQQLLAYSRKQVLELRVLRLSEVLERNEAMLRRILGEDVQMEVNCAQETGRVRADLHQLEQVLLNLVVNARDAMPEGGKLVLETANVVLDEEYASSHADATPGHYVMMAVSDNGPGINSETKARMFDPFFTTKEAGKGTGLGLAMVYGIVKQHGGNIYVYSELGRGTTFKIYLPMVSDEPEAIAVQQSFTGLEGGSETVMVVEDDNAVREFLRRSMERLGYRVTTAANGPEALEKLRTEPPQLSLLITDVIMPEMSGKELAKAMAKDRPDMKVLYISGYTDNVIAHHGVLDDGVAFLQKPFNIASLAQRVRQLLSD